MGGGVIISQDRNYAVAARHIIALEAHRDYPGKGTIFAITGADESGFLLGLYEKDGRWGDVFSAVADYVAGGIGMDVLEMPDDTEETLDAWLEDIGKAMDTGTAPGQEGGTYGQTAQGSSRQHLL